MKSQNIIIAVEGIADEVLLRKMLDKSGKNFQVLACYGKRGKDFLRQNLSKFVAASAQVPYLVLADLNNEEECAPILVKKWLPKNYQQLLLRIAVREMESWLMADREGFATFLAVASNKIPNNPESIPNPKESVVALARRSRRGEIREDMVPQLGSTSKVGKNYNGKLIEFINSRWDLNKAETSSPSLLRAMNALRKLPV